MKGGYTLLASKVVLLGAVGKDRDTGGGYVRLEGIGVVLMKKMVEKVGGMKLTSGWGV